MTDARGLIQSPTPLEPASLDVIRFRKNQVFSKSTEHPTELAQVQGRVAPVAEGSMEDDKVKETYQRRNFKVSFIEYENTVFDELINMKRVTDAYATHLVNLHFDVILYGFTQQYSTKVISDNIYSNRD